VYLIPPRIPAGGKYSPGVALILHKLMEEQDGKYQICGPTAFNFYGFDDQISNVTYAYNNRISGNRTIGNLEFQFIKIVDTRLGAVNSFQARNGGEIIYSSKARTLMDAVYKYNDFNLSLPRVSCKVRLSEGFAEKLSKIDKGKCVLKMINALNNDNPVKSQNSQISTS
jgi:hypothetical protein